MPKEKSGPVSDIRTTSPARIRVGPATSRWLMSMTPVLCAMYQPSSSNWNEADRFTVPVSACGSK
jgi:hypothetical protein